MQYGAGKIPFIQALRGVAAVLVVIYHAGYYLNYSFPLGEHGVDLFFVISGYVMMRACRKDFGNRRAFLPFLWRRATRIFPVYWQCTAIFLLAWNYVILPQFWLFYYTISVTKSLFLLPQRSGPLLGVAWTLQYEIYFYLVFSLLFLAPRKLSWAVFIGWICAMFYFDFAALDLEFVLGCLLALLPAPRMSCPNWLCGLGDSSYSLYLLHPMILQAMSVFGLSLVSIPVCIAAGLLNYRYVEKPLLRVLNR